VASGIEFARFPTANKKENIPPSLAGVVIHLGNKTKSTIQSTVQITKLESESKFRHLPITYKKWKPGTCKIADCYYSPTGYPFLVQNCRQDILFWHKFCRQDILFWHTRHHHDIILTCTSVRPHCVLHMCEGLRLRENLGVLRWYLY